MADIVSQRPAYAIDLRRFKSLFPIITGTLPSGISAIGPWIAIVGQSMNAAANTEQVVTHNLGRIPNGYIVIRSKLGGVVYDPTDGDARWTTTTMILRDTVAADVVSLMIL